MGFVLDGILMGCFDVFGGSFIFCYVDNENLGFVVVFFGVGDVLVFSYLLFGLIVFYNIVRLLEEMGGMVVVMVGDFDLQCIFVKLEIGDIDGFCVYVSCFKIDSDLWCGFGIIDCEYIEVKVFYEFGDSYIQVIMVLNDFFDYDLFLVLVLIFVSNYYYGYQVFILEGCVSVDLGVYDFNGDGIIDDSDFIFVFIGFNCIFYYEDCINICDDKFYLLGFGIYLLEDIQLIVIVYFEDKDGYGVLLDSYINLLGIYEDQVVVGLDVVYFCGV